MKPRISLTPQEWKPYLRPDCKWTCEGFLTRAYGETPASAYRAWHRISADVQRDLSPRPQPVMPESD